MFHRYTESNYNLVLKYYSIIRLMNANNSLEHDKSSFSKILLSKEVADIIKQVVKGSTPTIRPKCNDREKHKFGRWHHV